MNCLKDYVARYGLSSAHRLPLTRFIPGNVELGIAPLPDATFVGELGSMQQ